MGTITKQPQFSTYISDFCKMVADVQRDYEWNREEVNRLDKLTQDYLHQLELDGSCLTTGSESSLFRLRTKARFRARLTWSRLTTLRIATATA